MKLIALPHGIFAKVDDSDFEHLSTFTWHKTVSGYPCRNTSRKSLEGSRAVYMHKQVMGFPDCEVDHIDGDKLNCQRSNLRPCTRNQNCRNQSLSRANTSGYKGVIKANHKWRARVKINGKHKHMGYWDTPEEAAAAYNSGARILFGEFAKLNPIPAPHRQSV